MNKKLTFNKLVNSIHEAHGQLAAKASKAVNISLTLRNWIIGCYIAEYELNGADRAKYGESLLDRLSIELEKQGMNACARRQLYQYVRFYQTYPAIVRSATAQLQHLVLEWISTSAEKVR